MGEWEHGMVRAHALFDSSVVSFDVRYMLVSGGDVKLGMEVSEASPHGLELVVGHDDGNSEPPSGICANDSLEMFHDMAILHIIQFTS